MSEPQHPSVPPYAQGDRPAPSVPPAPPAGAPQQRPEQTQAAWQQPSAQPQQPPAAPQQPYPPQPHQQQAAPQHPQPQHPQAQHPGYAAHPGGPAPERTQTGPGNPLGRTAFLIAVVMLGIGLLAVLVQPFLYGAGDYQLIGLFNVIVSIIVVLGSVAALVIGLIALRRPAPHFLAGIAVGIAGVEILGRIVGWVSTLFYGFL